MNQCRESCVVQVAVYEQGPLEELEFGKRKVSGSGRVSALLAKYAQSHMSFLNH